MDKRLLTLKFPECGVTTLYLNGKTYTREEFHKAQHKGKVFKKNIGVNVSPVEWNKKTYQVKNISISSIAINKKLQATTNLIREVWGVI